MVRTDGLYHPDVRVVVLPSEDGVRFVLSLLCVALFLGCDRSGRDALVLYTSQDQFYVEPILREFTRQTGVQVRAVFDTESAKTAGLANRLRQEAARPRCDVFWSNEEMHTRLLMHEGVIKPDAVRTVGYRTRRIVVNTNLVSMADAPSDLMALTNSVWKNKVASAYPLYGTTSSHFVALRQLWGEEVWTRWCEGLVANGARIVDGNSVVVRLVGSGEVLVGLTDSDDVAAGNRAGLPVAALPLTPEMPAIANTISVVSADRASEAARLMDFLSSGETINGLLQAGALEGGDIRSVAASTLPISWTSVPTELPLAQKTLKQIFLRS
jgi:iron(III) transport system substrate-binding protein